jgi:hypothetical protein
LEVAGLLSLPLEAVAGVFGAGFSLVGVAVVELSPEPEEGLASEPDPAPSDPPDPPDPPDPSDPPDPPDPPSDEEEPSPDPALAVLLVRLSVL